VGNVTIEERGMVRGKGIRWHVNADGRERTLPRSAGPGVRNGIKIVIAIVPEREPEGIAADQVVVQASVSQVTVVPDVVAGL
jgi:hypothetical protein